MTKVLIGCPVRNRAWILPQYLNCLEQLAWPQSLIEYCFIINDCIDQTEQILEQFARRQSASVRLIAVNSERKPAYLRGEYSFSHLADLRNLLLREFLHSDCDFLFSLDSDILAPPDSLSRLIDSGCEVISCLVCNGHILGDLSVYNILEKSKSGRYIHIRNFPRDCIFPVDCTGAAYLIQRPVVERYGVYYTAQYGAEDIGFCENARQKGIPIFCDGRIECVHMMKEV